MHLQAIGSTSSRSQHAGGLVALIRAEYDEIPGLSLTLAQAARLWNADRQECLAALEALTNEGFLRCSRETYVRVACGRRGA
jgi:hypothetical protein